MGCICKNDEGHFHLFFSTTRDFFLVQDGVDALERMAEVMGSQRGAREAKGMVATCYTIVS